MDAELEQKTLKIYNLKTTNATLKKLTMIMYLYEVFHMLKNLGEFIGVKRG